MLCSTISQCIILFYTVCKFSATLAPLMDGMAGDHLFILDFQMGFGSDSFCKVLWISNCGVFLNGL